MQGIGHDEPPRVVVNTQRPLEFRDVTAGARAKLDEFARPEIASTHENAGSGVADAVHPEQQPPGHRPETEVILDRDDAIGDAQGFR